MRRVAVVASHPIQYQAPWFRALARAVDLEVFFCHRQDAAAQGAAGFGTAFDWDVPLLDGYSSTWLDNRSAHPSVDAFGGCDTPEIADRLAAGRFDACIVNGWYLKSYLQAIRACGRLGMAVCSRGDSHLGSPRRLTTRVVKYLPYRWLLRRIDAHLYVGSANRAYLRHYGVPDARLFFAPHFVDVDRFARGAEEAQRDGRARALRESIGVPGGARVILMAGKLIDIKRPRDFVEALARLSGPRPDVCGVIVGSGPLESSLRAHVAAEQIPIRFAGFRNQSDMPVCYAMADVVAVSSEAETWGLVVNEAMASGVPVVMSDTVGAAADLADDRRTGFRFAVGDVQALSDAIELALDALSTQAGDVRAALAQLMQTFSVERAVSGTLEALDAVCRTPSLEAAGRS